MKTKGLGKAQKELVKRMQTDGLVIKSFVDYHSATRETFLTNDDDDTICSISERMIESLHKRKLVDISTWHPSVRISITTIRIKANVLI